MSVAQESTSWQERYADKLMSAQQSVTSIHHGQRVFVGSGAGDGFDSDRPPQVPSLVIG